VKSGDSELLARLSIVGLEGNCLFDSYVRPKEKITDYLTEVSGVTFTHIKNAPDMKTVVDQAKKIMYNKIVIGHTVDKDFEVCGLKHWKGYKALININEFAGFQEPNGRLISLRNLSLKFLGKNIQ
jgi:RNA exonuclease 4